MNKNQILLAAGLLSLSAFTSQAALLTVAAGSISSTSNTTWVTDGYATLGAEGISGANWEVSGLQEGNGNDWNYLTGGGPPYQENYGTGPGQNVVEWPSTGSTQGLGFIYNDGSSAPLVLGVEEDMVADLAGSTCLRISTVVPYAGDYTLNGFTVTGATYGSVVTWYVLASTVANNDTMNFTSTAVVTPFPNAKISAGAVGFSASNTIPEPSTWASLIAGAAALIGFRTMRRRRV